METVEWNSLKWSWGVEHSDSEVECWRVSGVFWSGTIRSGMLGHQVVHVFSSKSGVASTFEVACSTVITTADSWSPQFALCLANYFRNLPAV